MSKKDLQIIQFDPDDFYITAIDLILTQLGLGLKGSAYDLETSKRLIDRITKKELLPNVAIIEAHMGKSEFDGEKIAQKLKELIPKIKIIGLSTYETKDWADIQAIKSLKNQEESIVKALEEITGETFEISNMSDPSE